MSTTLPLSVLVELVRLKLYEAIVLDDEIFVDVAYLQRKFDSKFTRAFIISAVRQLENNKHIVFEQNSNKKPNKWMNET